VPTPGHIYVVRHIESLTGSMHILHCVLCPSVACTLMKVCMEEGQFGSNERVVGVQQWRGTWTAAGTSAALRGASMMAATASLTYCSPGSGEVRQCNEAAPRKQHAAAPCATGAARSPVLQHAVLSSVCCWQSTRLVHASSHQHAALRHASSAVVLL
jgi:hypothetical protein